MELLQVLSKTTSRRKRRRKARFLLPETEVQFLKYEEEVRKLRAERIAATVKHGKECLAQAKILRTQARQILSIQHENDAEYELARRDAKQRKDEAKKLRKKGKAFTLRAWSFTLYFWKLPEAVHTSQDSPPSSYWGCRSQARLRASLFEQARIVHEGETVYSKHGSGANNKYWHYERRLVRYQGRIFLAQMGKRVDAQPHDPWQICWVTDSPSQMTEAELRYTASQAD